MRRAPPSATVLSVSLPRSLLEQADQVALRRNYSGRSELVRAALREFIAQDVQEPSRFAHRSATLTLAYPKGQERRIGEIRHLFGDVVKVLLHFDDSAECVEIMRLGGDGPRIEDFVDRLRGYRETRLVAITYTDPPAPAMDSQAVPTT